MLSRTSPNSSCYFRLNILPFQINFCLPGNLKVGSNLIDACAKLFLVRCFWCGLMPPLVSWRYNFPLVAWLAVSLRVSSHAHRVYMTDVPRDRLLLLRVTSRLWPLRDSFFLSVISFSTFFRDPFPFQFSIRTQPSFFFCSIYDALSRCQSNEDAIGVVFIWMRFHNSWLNSRA